jgi:hypothetical protein
MGTPLALGGGGVAVCVFFLFNCKLDLHVLHVTLIALHTATTIGT